MARVPDVTELLTDFRLLLAFGFGTGLAPKAPGTAGTVVGLMLYLVLPEMPVWQYVVLCLVMSVVGVWLCEYAANWSGVKDHPGIVFDEIVGYLVTMTFAPAGLGWALLGFLLFRVFDILKPFPIDVLDKNCRGGFGIMIDDIVAGLASLQFIVWLVQV